MICAVRERWTYFWVGWVSLGLTWFIGAFSQDPENPPRERGQNLLLILATGAAVVALGILGARPTPILGLSGAALGSSVGNGARTLGFSSGNCRQSPGGAWVCDRWDSQYSGSVPYRVEVDGVGCWKGLRLGPPDEGSPKRISGCVNLSDYVFDGGGSRGD